MPTKINARIVADSINPKGDRITTYVAEYPKFIHGEFMTHRAFSRNASSSRAIPVEKQIKRVIEDPALPVFWGKNQTGMQAAEELDDTPSFPDGTNWSPRKFAQKYWLEARDSAVDHVQKMLALGLHKQLANRPLETWMWISVVVTSTDAGLNNFFNLRYHKMAQPEIQVLAQEMWEERQRSVPVRLFEGQWHLPFITPADLFQGLKQEDPLFLPKLSSARCARVSYNNHDGTAPVIEKDLELYERLMGGFPKHASPTEHQARVPIAGMDTFPHEAMFPEYAQIDEHLRSNLTGWIQFRKLIPGEFMPVFNGPDRIQDE